MISGQERWQTKNLTCDTICIFIPLSGLHWKPLARCRALTHRSHRASHMQNSFCGTCLYIRTVPQWSFATGKLALSEMMHEKLQICPVLTRHLECETHERRSPLRTPFVFRGGGDGKDEDSVFSSKRITSLTIQRG